MIFKETSNWNEDFFQSWNILYREIYSSAYFLNEDIESLKRILTSEHYKSTKWKAFLLFNESDQPVCRILIAIDDKSRKVAKMGFLETKNEPSLFHSFLDKILTHPFLEGVNSLKGPINFNFFISYRLRLFNKEPLFLGEPQQPDYYQKLLINEKFRLIKTWDTYKLVKQLVRRDMKKLRKKLNPEKRLSVRFLNPFHFERDLKIIYHLFIETYKQMPEFESISWEAFRLIYIEYRFLFNPFFNYIIYDKNRPIGFSINLFDQKENLLWYQTIKNKFQDKRQEKLLKCILFFKILFSRKRLLIIYVGRKSGDEYKGVQALVSKKLSFWSHLFMVKEGLSSFVADDSPSKNSFNHTDHYQLISQYGVFERKLE
jgi:hypothetical protein